MYPNPALSAGQLALIAIVAALGVAFWLGSVFLAGREPRRESNAATASLPQRPAVADQLARKAAADEPARKAA